VTNLIIDVFRLHGGPARRRRRPGRRSRGDQCPLAGARPIVFPPVPLPVAHLARNMGLSRQAVQRSVDEMKDARLVHFVANPHHRRAMLVVVTAQGEVAYQAASVHQQDWSDTLTTGFSPEVVEAAGTLLRDLWHRPAEGAGSIVAAA
jgi:DNA-binding MarR family transcriptional regulator